jgi:hypothetical protein
MACLVVCRREKGHGKKDSWVTVERPGEDA